MYLEKKQQMKQGFNSTIIDGYSGFIFTNRCGYVHNPQTINRAIKRIYTACNEQEVEQAKKEHRQPVLIPHFSVHNLRHTFCTRFCENETDLKIIQEIMGHSDIGVTLNTYTHLQLSDKKKLAFVSIFMKKFFSYVLIMLLAFGCVSSTANVRNDYIEGTSIVVGLLVPYNGNLVGIQAFTYLSGKRYKSYETNLTIKTSHSITNKVLGCECIDVQETDIN